MEDESFEYVPSVFAGAAAETAIIAASRGQRAVHFLVDSGLCTGILYYPVTYLFGATLRMFGLDIFAALADPMEAWPVTLLMAMLIHTGYHALVEGATGGRSLGKLITRTTAVRLDRKPFTRRDAARRALCRLIPFEPLSTFGKQPWHDRLTKTSVIQKPQAFLPLEAPLPESSTIYDVRP